ncbi:MAG: CO dehydrogenase/CO-methylating acetyl-CoA synthase complex subunit beta [Candidatus Syntropharchaeia archaeon]
MAGKIFDRERRAAESGVDYEKPEFRDYIKLSLKTEAAWDDIPIAIGRQYEGERIRASDMYVEFGGPRVEYKGERVILKKPGEVEPEKVTIIGKDIDELEEGGAYPLAFIAEVAGQLSDAMELTLATRVHHWTNFCNGVMHLNGKDDIWVRFSKEAVSKGFKLKEWGKVIARLYSAEFSNVEAASVTIITDPEKVKEAVLEMREYWAEKDRKALQMREEDTKPWYSCTLCQSFASSHVCIISPERPASCGAITWLDAKAGHEMEPTGAWQPFDPGECLDPLRGEWSGVNEEVAKRSGGINTRYYMHSLFGYPHTSCGCFEAVSFYIPEVDGIGIVDRKFTAPTVNKLPFSTMAARTGGGQQTEGLLGTSMGYMKSRKFWQAEGGWKRVVWMPSELKETMSEWIPEEMRDRIATEKDVSNIEELREFLKEKNHPVVERWKKGLTKEDLIAYVEEREGELDPEECAEEFGVSVDEVMALVEELIEEGIFEE